MNVNLCLCIADNNAYFGFRLLRGSTAIREWWGYQMSDGSYQDNSYVNTGKHIDTPATTSATTYKMQIYASWWNLQSNKNLCGTINRSSGDSDSAQNARQASMYAMEVS